MQFVMKVLKSLLVLILNNGLSFQGCHIIETGLSDFHIMTVTVMKMHFKKQDLRVTQYAYYKMFNTQRSRENAFACVREC